MLLVVLAVCLCVIVAGVVVAVFSSGGRGGGAGAISGGAGAISGTASSPAVAGTPSARPTAGHKITAQPVVAGAGLAKTALQWPPGLTHQILHWRAGPGEAALSAVTAQLGYAMQAAAVKLYPSMRLTCVKLASDIQTAQAAPPIPDAAMQRLYAKALAGLSSAAVDCRHAISTRPSGDETLDIHLNKAQLSRTQAGFTIGSKRIYNATAQIQALRH